MKTRSLTTRLVGGTILVALLAALAGAATAALLSRGLWQAREQQVLRAMAADLERATSREASEEGWSLERAAPEALRESVLSGHRVEVWRDRTLLAASLPGPTIGPDPGSNEETMAAWLVETRSLPDGLRLVVASPRERGREAARLFTWALVLSAPVSLGLAALIGRFVGRRATRPLVDFKDRMAAARPFEALPSAGPAESTTEVRDLERSFAVLWERLGEALRREREFAANASHELRTPLTRMRLQAERARPSAGAAAEGPLDELLAEVDRMVRLVDSLLVLSRDVAAGIPLAETVNLADLVAATSCRVFAGTKAPELRAPDEALVRGDEALLGIAVENLLGNARKFAAPDQAVRLAVWEEAGRVGLAVTSPGSRIAEGEAERLFDRFYRSPEARVSREGYGLGLPLARHIARLHGGDVRSLASAGADARFELQLPAWTPTPGDHSPPLAETDPPP